MLFKNKNLVSQFFKGLGVKALSATLALGVLSSGVHAMDPAGDVDWQQLLERLQPGSAEPAVQPINPILARLQSALAAPAVPPVNPIAPVDDPDEPEDEPVAQSAIDQLGLDVEREENGNVMVTYEHEGLSYCVAFSPDKEGADNPATQRALAEAILHGRSVVDFYRSAGQAGVRCDDICTVLEGTCDEENGICTLNREYGRVRCLFYGNATDLADAIRYSRRRFSYGDTTWPPRLIEGLEVRHGEGPIEVEEKEEESVAPVVLVEDEEEPEVPAAPVDNPAVPEDNLEGFVPFVPAAPAVRLPNPSAQSAIDRIGLDIQRLGYSNRIVTYWNNGVFHCVTFLPASCGADRTWTQRALADAILQGGNVPAFYRSADQAGIRCDRAHTLFEGTCDEESGICTLNREDGNAQCVFLGNEPTLVTVIKEAGRLYHEGNKAWPPEMIKDFILTEDHDEDEIPVVGEEEADAVKEEDHLCDWCYGEDNDPDDGSLIQYVHTDENCGKVMFLHKKCFEDWKKSGICLKCQKNGCSDKVEVKEIK